MLLVLASASPRRADLLRAAGFEFEVDPADVDEGQLTGETPAEYVARVAQAKADVVAARRPDAVVLAADTTVVLRSRSSAPGGVTDLLGKPRDAADAAEMLRRLSGRSHHVLTGVAIVSPRGARAFVDSTEVWFSRLADADISGYVASGEPMGKAGGYAIQGRASRFVSRIEGSYTNVVGLPVARVHGELRGLMGLD